MQYFSTNRNSAHAPFREATLRGQPDDKGLYFPERIPVLSRDFWERFPTLTKAETALEVIRPYVAESIDEESLAAICAETVDFDFPLVPITERISALELFHGPTLAFKDVGARFMSRCLRHFARDLGERAVVIVATSGDTGGAVAGGFHGVEGVDVVILYPSGKVSRVQELQLTTFGGNITAIEVEGNFDDCQAMAKTALADEDLKRRVFLTSANSINVARWLPQQFYYFFAYRDWLERESGEPVISVPSGNFGNICAGILAHISGLPCRRFIAACNANDVVPRFLGTGRMETRRSVATLSNAMDVASPSNFVRILEIFDHDYLRLKDRMDSVSITDEETAAVMRRVYRETGYVLDPHGAVGYLALERRLENHPDETGYFLETAHPVKFDSVESILGTYGDVPESIGELLEKKKTSVSMPADYDSLRAYLASRY